MLLRSEGQVQILVTQQAMQETPHRGLDVQLLPAWMLTLL